MNPRSSWTICATRVCERPSKVERREKRAPVTSVTGKVTEADPTCTTGTESCTVASSACATGKAATQARLIAEANRGPIRFKRHWEMNWKGKNPRLDMDTSGSVNRWRVAVRRGPIQRSAVNARHVDKALVSRVRSRAHLLTARSQSPRSTRRRVFCQGAWCLGALSFSTLFVILWRSCARKRGNVLNKLASIVISGLHSGPYRRIRVRETGCRFNDPFGR